MAVVEPGLQCTINNKAFIDIRLPVSQCC